MSGSLPKVSVMIPTYNQAGFVARAVASAFAQDYPNLEVVVSDDGSADNTAEVVGDLIRDHPDWNLAYSPNPVNLGILRNYHETLFRKINGDWVVNLDADDFFVDPAFLSAAIVAAQSDPAIALVFANYREFNDLDGSQLDIRNPPHPPVLRDAEFFAAYAAGRIRWNHNAIVYRRADALAKGCYWQPDRPRNDWESFLRLIVGHKAGYLDQVVAAWVQHGANETRRLDRDKYLTNFVLIDGVADFAREAGMPAAFVANWATAMYRSIARDCCAAYARQRDLAGMIGYLKRAPAMPGFGRLRTAFAPGMLARFVAASIPGLHDRAKRIRRRAFAQSASA
jgi:glycosyltransferase involved in cell wall biosynthesis